MLELENDNNKRKRVRDRPIFFSGKPENRCFKHLVTSFDVLKEVTFLAKIVVATLWAPFGKLRDFLFQHLASHTGSSP